MVTVSVVAASLIGGMQPALAGKPVIAYYAGWYGGSQVGAVPWDALSQINVAFAGIDSHNHCAWMQMDNSDAYDTSGTLPSAVRALIAARNAHNPAVKIVLSVGGDVMSYRFSHAVATPASAQALATSCVNFVNGLGMDGVDYDWEYPGLLGRRNCPGVPSAPWPCYDAASDAAHFTTLLQATRKLLTPAQTLSIAAAPNNGHYDYAGLQANLNFVNLMIYDIHGWPGDMQTGFNAPLSAAKQALTSFASQGVAKEKLILGVPFYGYQWSNVSNPALGSPGQPQGTMPYSDVLNKWATDPGCTLYANADGYYYHCSQGRYANDWVSVDPPEMMRQKAMYVRQNGYGGLMYWVIPGDAADHRLTQAMTEGLASGPVNAALIDIMSDWP